MPISKSEVLFALINSMTRGEKRHFKSFAQRESEEGTLKYLHLFHVLDKQEFLDEEELAEKFNRSQLPNLKRHLYTQILISLRLQKRKNNVSIQLREYFDYANILYGRGLYLQSLRIIEKAKTLAEKINDKLILLQLLEFGKIIETRHITRTGTERVKNLTDDTEELRNSITNHLILSNLRIRLHGNYIKYGHVNSQQEADEVRTLFKSGLR